MASSDCLSTGFAGQGIANNGETAEATTLGCSVGNDVHSDPVHAIVMTPSLGGRFSGINATMEALTPTLQKSLSIACCGYNLGPRMPIVGLWRWLCKGERKRWRIWHARRNNDMLVGILLRYVFRQRLALIWTSAAQRKHTWITRFCYKRMDAVIATTQIAADFLCSPAVVSHHGVDAQKYSPPVGSRADARQKLGIQPLRAIGVFGRIRPQKGTGDFVESLIKVLPDYPHWQVIFVGEVTPDFSAYQQQLIDQLSKAGIADRVHFIGFLKDFDELPLWYQALDAVACVSRNEGFGVTCLEAMSTGIPVLATRAGAWPDIIDNGRDGWIVDAGNIGDLSRGLRQLLDTSDVARVQMGQAAREKVLQRYTIEREAERVIAIYSNVFRRFGDQT